jgi:hypothetical protein
MASKVSISNMALVRIGVNSITSLTEDSEQARLCNLVFNQSLDYLLQLYPWNFALVRTSLAQSSSNPIYDYAYQYQLPTDPFCLQVVSVEDGTEYKIEGRLLLTDEQSINIIYIKRVTDMNELTALFIETMIFYMGAQLALPLTNNKGMADAMFSQYQVALQKARMRDAQEDTPKAMQEVGWITTRR